jgi:sulfotransferase family protein
MIYINSQTSKTDVWPNFFIVGAARAGTTTLYEYLRQVPGIFLPSIKEPRYFIARSIYEDIYGRIAVGNTKNYLDLFANSNATAIGEATPEYLYHDSAARKIQEKVPYAKIIITLRNPISRAFSHYLLLKGLRNIQRSFDEMVKSEWANNKLDLGGSLRSPGIIECGFYSRGLSKYFELFGCDRIKIIIFEEWTKDAVNTINAIIEFLDVNYKFDDSVTIQKENTSRDYRRGNEFLYSVITKSVLFRRIYTRLPAFAHNSLKNIYHTQAGMRSSFASSFPQNDSMSNETRELIRDIYWKDVKELERILGRRLPWQDFQT